MNSISSVERRPAPEQLGLHLVAPPAKYRVVLPIEVNGRKYRFGSTIDLTLEEAKRLSHTLIALNEEERWQ